MNTKNNKKRERLSIPIFYQLLFACLYISGSYIANLLKYGNKKLFASIAISLCIIAFFYYLAYLVRLLFNPHNRLRGIFLSVFTLILFPLISYSVVYHLLPLFGFYLYKPHIPFRLDEFLGKTFSAFYSLFTATAVYAWFYSKKLADRRNLELERAERLKQQQIDEMKSNLLLSILQSHYFKNSLHDIVCRAVELDDPYIPKLMPHLKDVLDYSAHMLQGNIMKVSIERELDIIENMIASIRLRHANDEVVVIHQKGTPNGQFIAPLVLATLLENFFTHGEVSKGQPLVIDITFRPGYFSFSCTNKKRMQLHKRVGGGRGLQLVQQSLLQLPNTEHQLTYKEVEDLFTICLTINYTI